MTAEHSLNPHRIDDYLAQVRQALEGADPAMIQDALSDADKNNDVVQVRAAIDVARATHKDGFVQRT